MDRVWDWIVSGGYELLATSVLLLAIGAAMFVPGHRGSSSTDSIFGESDGDGD